jgi:hypothetical protein
VYLSSVYSYANAQKSVRYLQDIPMLIPSRRGCLLKMNDWRNIVYLNRGTVVQKEVYDLLIELDIICEVYDHAQFTTQVSRYFGAMDDFVSVSRVVQGVPRTKINFMAGGWPIEIFGQPRGTELQNGYLHMIVEAEILNQMDEDFRQQILTLKSSGWKTEPAFAQVLGLEGDPYEAVLKLGKLPVRARNVL